MKILVSILFLSLAAMTVLADTTEHDAEYFHPAASLYIQGDSAGASNLVVKGLSLYPDDGKLKRLQELLKQEQEQKEQQQEQQQNQEQNNEEQNQENQNEESPPEPNEEQQQQEQPEPKPPEQMSEDEAKQLLDAMRQEEQNKRLQLHPVHGRPVEVDKDW